MASSAVPLISGKSGRGEEGLGAGEAKHFKYLLCGNGKRKTEPKPSKWHKPIMRKAPKEPKKKK